MMLLTKVSMLMKLAVACFLIGFGAGYWFAAETASEAVLTVPTSCCHLAATT